MNRKIVEVYVQSSTPVRKKTSYKPGWAFVQVYTDKVTSRDVKRMAEKLSDTMFLRCMKFDDAIEYTRDYLSKNSKTDNAFNRNNKLLDRIKINIEKQLNSGDWVE